MDLSLPREPNFRIEIPTNATNFDPSKVQLIRRATGNAVIPNNPFNLGNSGGGWEVIHKGPLTFDKSLIKIYPLP